MALAPGIATAMRTISSIAIVACLFIVFIHLKYQRIQRKSLHKVVCYIACCDIFSSIGIMIGLPQNGTFPCYLQSVLTNIFPLSGVFWTTTIAYMVYCIIYNAEKINVTSYRLLAITCGFPVILTILPLSTETYGSPKNDDWCFIRERASSNSPSWTTVFWSIFSFYGWVYLCILIYVILLCLAFAHVVQMRNELSFSRSLSKMQSSLFRLIWYPMIALFVWLPSAVYDVNELSSSDDDYTAGRATQYFAYLLPATHGICLFCVYVATNSDVRVVFLRLLCLMGLPEPSLLESLMATSEASSAGDKKPQLLLRNTSANNKSSDKDTSNPLGWTGDNEDNV